MDIVSKPMRGRAAFGNLLVICAIPFSFWLLGAYFIGGGEHPLNAVLSFLHLPTPFSEAFPDSWFELISLQTFVNWTGAGVLPASIVCIAIWIRDGRLTTRRAGAR